MGALEQLHGTLSRLGVRLLVCELNEQPLSLLERAGFASVLGADNLHADLSSALAAAAASPP